MASPRKTGLVIKAALFCALSFFLLCILSLEARAAEKISIEPGFNGIVSEISNPDSSGTRYVAGSFTAVSPWGTGGLALADKENAEINPSFPKVNGQVRDIEPDGTGGFYIAGSFSCIGQNPSGSCGAPGDFQRDNLAHIDSSGNVSSWNPGTDGAVNSIKFSEGILYIGGDFSNVAGVARESAASVTTAGILSGWNPNITGEVDVITVSGNRVYLGGDFSLVSGSVRSSVAALTKDGSLLPWNPDARASSTSYVHAIEVVGDTVYLGGLFDTIKGEGRGNVAAIEDDGDLLPWSPVADGPVLDFAATSSALYIAGGFDNFAGQPRSSLAAISLPAKNLLPWTAEMDSPSLVSSLEVSEEEVYFAGSFRSVNGEQRRNSAALETGGSLLPWEVPVNSSAYAIAVVDKQIALGGLFENAGGAQREGLAAIASNGDLLSWSPSLQGAVGAIKVENNTIYLGGQIVKIEGSSRSSLAALAPDGTLLPWAPDVSGDILDLDVSDGIVYIAGDFSEVEGAGRNNAAAIEVDGDLSPWDPDVSDSLSSAFVSSLEVNGNTVYLGGQFDSVGGTTRNNGAAISTGGVLENWRANTNGPIADLNVIADAVYFAGSFSLARGEARNSAAAVEKSNDLSSWNPNVSGDVYSLAQAGGNIYFGGNFNTVSGQSRGNVAATTPAGAVLPWNPATDGGVYTMAGSADAIYLGGSFNEVSGNLRGRAAKIALDGTLGPVWPRSTASLSVTKSGSGTVTSNPAGISCGSDCSESVTQYETVDLAATPAQGFEFVGWGGACQGTSPCSVYLDRARTVSAQFVRSPEIVFVEIDKPKKMKKGKKATWKVTVKNKGGLDLKGAEVRYNYPQKGSKRVKGKKEIGTIAPGKSKTVKIKVKIQKRGKAKVVLTASSSNGGKKEKRKTVRVR